MSGEGGGGGAGGVPTELNGQQHPHQVVHVRENSDSALEEMFKVLDNPNRAKNLFKEKNLPKSFFTPPAHPTRPSQENLLQAQQQQQQQADGPFHGSIVPQHSRSQSSPAQLANTLSILPSTPNHRPQHSVDFAEDLAGGWERNQRYMLK